MIISCIGHAEFLIELENGMRIATDPYDDTCGYPVIPVKAEAVLLELDGRRVEYAVKVEDEHGLLGEGTHQRYIIDPERFMAKLG